jgi:hypothetical protein
MNPSDFLPGLYRHFKGGLYYAMCTASEHDASPSDLSRYAAHDVVYYSYDKKEWKKRPLASKVGLADKDRVGFFDKIEREGFAPGTPRFALIQEVPPNVAFGPGAAGSGVPWVPLRPHEEVTLKTLSDAFWPMIDTMCGSGIRAKTEDLDGVKMTYSGAKARLLATAPALARSVDVFDGLYMLGMMIGPNPQGFVTAVPLMTFARGESYPPDPCGRR